MSKEKKVVWGLFVLFGFSLIFSVFQSVHTMKQSSLSIREPLLLIKKGIGVLTINGPISFSSSHIPSPADAESILEQIKLFSKDNRVKALLVRINSPGGTVGASQEIYHALLDYKEKTNTPIIASIGDLGASGAYYAALAADTIFANEGSIVGSIGVILGNVNFSKLAKEHGVYLDVYKSGLHKDILSSWRTGTDKERALLNVMIQTVHTQFVEALMAGRDLSEVKARKLADGQFFSGEQAKSLGLVDKLGGMQYAIEYTARLVGLPADPHLISKSKPSIYDFFSIWKDQMGGLFGASIHSLFLDSRPVLR